MNSTPTLWIWWTKTNEKKLLANWILLWDGNILSVILFRHSSRKTFTTNGVVIGFHSQWDFIFMPVANDRRAFDYFICHLTIANYLLIVVIQQRATNLMLNDALRIQTPNEIYIKWFNGRFYFQRNGNSTRQSSKLYNRGAFVWRNGCAIKHHIARKRRNVHSTIFGSIRQNKQFFIHLAEKSCFLSSIDFLKSILRFFTCEKCLVFDFSGNMPFRFFGENICRIRNIKAQYPSMSKNSLWNEIDVKCD